MLNQISTVGAWIAGTGMVLFVINLVKSAMHGKPANMEDPFKIGEQYYDYTKREPHY
jgi:cytochrome c oxidase subunit 1